MKNVRVRGAGINKVVEVSNGATYNDVLTIFSAQEDKNIQGYIVYAGGTKITDTNSEVRHDEILVVKGKHEHNI